MSREHFAKVLFILLVLIIFSIASSAFTASVYEVPENPDNQLNVFISGLGAPSEDSCQSYRWHWDYENCFDKKLVDANRTMYGYSGYRNENITLHSGDMAVLEYTYPILEPMTVLVLGLSGIIIRVHK